MVLSQNPDYGMTQRAGLTAVPGLGLHEQNLALSSFAIHEHNPFFLGQSKDDPFLAQWKQVLQRIVQLTPTLESLIQNFWGLTLPLKFFSMSAQNQFVWEGEEYFGSRVPMDPDQKSWAELRISEVLCGRLINEALGHHNLKHPNGLPMTPEEAPPFTLGSTTPCERFLLDEFAKDTFQKMFHDVAKRPLEEEIEHPILHLIWLCDFTGAPIHPTDIEAPAIGKIVFSIPWEALRDFEYPEGKEPPETPHIILGEEPLLDIAIAMTVAIGETRIQLEDLKFLESGDVVMLENSDANQLSVLVPKPTGKITFPIEITNRKQYELIKTQEVETMEQAYQDELEQQDNLWDTLLIDVNAEFSATRIPLRQLKTMSEGEVVEVSDLVANKIRLHVKGKTLAHGELVIIGDKFGVLITEIPGGITTQPTAAPTAPTSGVTPPTMPPAPEHHPESTPHEDMEQHSPMGSDEEDYGTTPAQGGEEEMMDDDLDDYLNTDFDEDDNF